MCLAAIALDTSRRFPLVIAANRDEFHDRPTARLGWWRPDPNGPEVLSGRDLSAGGTWLGLSLSGRLGLLTNVREPARHEPDAPSRGGLVTRWLTGDHPPDRFWVRASLMGHNGFNFIAADFSRGECHWMSNRARYAQRLEKGIHGVSNGRLDEPWPKVVRLKQDLADALAQHEDTAPGPDALAQTLMAALTSRTVAQDEDLPVTGVGLDLERQLSAAFVRTADGRYGTRSSTVIVTERTGRTLVTHVFERSYPAAQGMALMRRATLKDWPPRYQTSPIEVPVDPRGADYAAPVQEADMTGFEHEGDTSGSPALPPATRTVRPRVRSLLRPAR